MKSRGSRFIGSASARNALQQIHAGVAGKLAVVGEAGHVEIDVSAPLVGVTLLHQRADYRQHFGDVLAGPREHVSIHYVQPRLVAMETASVQLGDLLDGLALGQGGEDHLVATGLHQFLTHMADVGNVLDVMDLEAVMHEGPANPVGHHVGPQVADMGVAINGRPAGVHAHFARLCGLDLFYPFCQGVVDTQHANLLRALRC